MSNENYGVISEQGFVTGNGLGFSPLNEEDLATLGSDQEVQQENK